MHLPFLLNYLLRPPISHHKGYWPPDLYSFPTFSTDRGPAKHPTRQGQCDVKSISLDDEWIGDVNVIWESVFITLVKPRHGIPILVICKVAHCVVDSSNRSSWPPTRKNRVTLQFEIESHCLSKARKIEVELKSLWIDLPNKIVNLILLKNLSINKSLVYLKLWLSSCCIVYTGSRVPDLSVMWISCALIGWK